MKPLLSCCLFLFLHLFSKAQKQEDTSFVPVHLLSLKAGVSLNNNTFSQYFVSSTYSIYGVVKGNDSAGTFLSDQKKYLANPYFNFGIRRQTARNKGFYFGITYTSSKNHMVSKYRKLSNEFYDGTNYQYIYHLQRGKTIGTNHLFRFELLLFKNIRHTHFEIGLVTADFRISSTKTKVREDLYEVVQKYQQTYSPLYDPDEPYFLSKSYAGSRTFEEKKWNISHGPHVPLSIGVEQYFDLDKIRLSAGTRAVFSAFGGYLAWQFYSGIHLKYKDRKYRDQ
jgi:hypothetical protein